MSRSSRRHCAEPGHREPSNTDRRRSKPATTAGTPGCTTLPAGVSCSGGRRLIRAIADHAKSGHILEIGCGTGANLLRLAGNSRTPP
jgi:tRNA G46 methylase TrmB